MQRPPLTPPSMRTAPLPLSLLALLGLGLGCPAQAPRPEQQAAQPVDRSDETPAGVLVADPEDDRVVRDSGDLYATESAPGSGLGSPSLGSGRPDTSNGTCKLFSPQLPTPECCPFETGFDAEQVKQLCGHALYMGESLYQSCGYYFLPSMEGSFPVALRGSRLQRESVEEAAAVHDRRMAQTLERPDFASTPVPGVEGAMWSSNEDVHWALLPGWSLVRLVSWTADACPIEAMPAVLKLMVEAKEVSPEAPRPGLVPIARQ